METKTFFDAWLETQKQLTDNWTESNRKLQDSVKNGAALNDGLSIYKEWLAKQSEITKAATEKAATTFQAQLAENAEAFKNGKTPVNVSEVYNNWLNAQREQMTKAMGNFQSFSNPFTANNPFATNPFLANNPFAANPMTQFQDFQNQFLNNTQNWVKKSSNGFSQFQNPFEAWGKNLNGDTLKDTWAGINNSNTAFARFYENWAPMYKSMTEKTFDADWMKKGFSADSFKDLMDRSIAMLTPGILKEQTEQIQNWFEVANNYTKHLQQQSYNAIPENLRNAFPFLANGTDPMNPDSNIFSMYMRNVMPVFRFLNPGKESELKENSILLLEKMAIYSQKAAELQQHIYVTGAKNWEKFLLEGFEQSKKGVDLGNTQEMFQQWVTKNEEAFTELFKSDAYSKLQGELVDLNLEIRQRNEKIAEEMLQSLPVVLRSEADELYTTIYELRKRLHSVEKQLGDTENSVEVKDAKSSNSKKKTATV